jgi:hypothetical protein
MQPWPQGDDKLFDNVKLRLTLPRTPTAAHGGGGVLRSHGGAEGGAPPAVRWSHARVRVGWLRRVLAGVCTPPSIKLVTRPRTGGVAQEGSCRSVYAALYQAGHTPAYGWGGSGGFLQECVR